jgi:C4-dicarboxylate transporter
MNLLISLIPLIVTLVLLFKKQHMLFAGLVGGILAILIGGLEFSKAAQMFVGGISNMLGITIPIIYAASAAMVSKAGSIESLVELSRRSLKGKISVLSGIIVLIQGFATYMAGMGAGNTMVTAPLVAAAVGAVPEVIAAMAIVSAVGFTTSPASTETVLAAESAGRDVIAHATAMRPYTIAFYLLAAGLAIYGVHKRGILVKENVKKENSNNDKSNKMLMKQSIPAIALLAMVVGGSKLNALIGVNLFSPATAVIFTGILTVILTPLSITETCDSLVDGSRFILTTLFAVGIFLSFINMIGELGTFQQLAALASNVPESIILPVAMIIAFLIAIPSGAFTAGVLTLILPTLSALGLPSEAMGFVAIATGLGTQISPVQINVAALAEGFDIEIIDVMKGNLKYILGALALLIVIGIIVI